MPANHAAAVPTCRSELLESKISKSAPKEDADVESKEEEENIPNDSAAKEPADIEQDIEVKVQAEAKDAEEAKTQLLQKCLYTLEPPLTFALSRHACVP